MATRARLTAQDFWRLGEGDVRRELVDGEVVEMAPVGGVHGEITLRIARKLAEHVDRLGTGKVLVGDVGFERMVPRVSCGNRIPSKVKMSCRPSRSP